VLSDFETQTLELEGQIFTIFKTSGPCRHPIEVLVIEDQSDAAPRVAHIVFFGIPFTARTFSWYGDGVGNFRHYITFPPEIITSQYRLNRRLGNLRKQSGRFGGEINLSPPPSRSTPGNELRFL
jgi:hypothetical protein